MAPADPRDLLRRHRRILCIGASRDPRKDAHRIPRYMQDHGYDVVPINPHADQVLGYPALDHVAEATPGGICAIYRPGAETPPFVKAALALGVDAIWLPQDVTSVESRRLAEEAGVAYVEDACLMVEHRRVFGDASWQPA